ncbi:hypothetical protein DL96DRAFT_1810838 [Flagelloscypha sp. PMI_526]|nr:hypothetical protein DL96DRAFT_1810838 [Flagelloscypha sp. PMI_526]
MDLEDQLLHSLLETLGPQLDAFCIQSVDDCNWDEFPDSFLDIFTTQVMPRIRSLDLNRIILIPLLATLRHCPHLQSLSLSERNYIIGASESGTGTGDIVPYTLPRVTSLEVEIFGLEDFEDDQGAPTSLKQLILLSGASIRSLYLGMCSSMYFPLKWEFLYPFHDLRNSLAHLAFGSHLYESVVFQFNNSTKDRDMGLDFWMFPQLQSISILIPIHTSPTGWGPWSRCLAQSLDYPHQAKLRILKFILLSNYYPVPASSTNPLDHMAKAVKFKIHVVTCGDLDEAVFAETAQAFRMDLPSWDADEKLEFWMGE